MFNLDSIEVGEKLTATFNVSTTPATDRSTIESQFESVENVEDIKYDQLVGVERAAPPFTYAKPSNQRIVPSTAIGSTSGSLHPGSSLKSLALKKWHSALVVPN